MIEMENNKQLAKTRNTASKCSKGTPGFFKNHYNYVNIIYHFVNNFSYFYNL